MPIALNIFFAVPFTMMFSTVLYITSSVGGCKWTISARSVRMDVAFWKFSNNPPNSDSVADSMTFLIMMHSKFTGPFYGVVTFIGVLDYVPWKNIHLLCFVPLVMRCCMHPNIYGESFRFYYVLLLFLDATRFNLITV